MKSTCALAILFLAAGVSASDAPASHWNGGRTVPVHRLAPLDADGDKVSCADALPRPFSQVKTCGQCHDVKSVHGGTHFRTGLDADEALDSRPGEPWFLANDQTGTSIPLALHAHGGVFAPRDLGLSCWQWTKLFGRSFPGGGIASDERAMAECAGDRQRWMVTGPLEPNCLACHQRGGWDSSEWARQVARENWRGAAVAASGLGEVRGMNERLDTTWNVDLRPENPDDHLFRVPENVAYNQHLFDSKNRCVFNVGKPDAANCLACHSATQKHMPSYAINGDVHLKRGMSCVDCHLNDISHRVKTRSCANCHTEPHGMGPMPRHTGLPLVHFKKLSCTVCHSGVTSGGKRAVVRTSRANRIGIYGRAQWATDNPFILEPVFVRNNDGVIEPRRMSWPSYFCALTNGVPGTPLAPEAVKDLKAFATTNAITRATIAAALRELAAGDGAGRTFGFIGHGKLWKLEGESVAATDSAAAAPVSWPFAHDVRPTRQALGATPVKCADCHSGDSEFFFGKITPAGPITDAKVAPVTQDAFLGVSALYHHAFGSSFAMRPVLKTLMWSAFAFLCLFAAAAAAIALARLSKKISDNTEDFIYGIFKWGIDMTLAASFAYLALSGFLGWLLGGMSGWWLVLHTVAGGAFASCTALAMLHRGPAPSRRWLCSVLHLAWIVLAAAVIFTAVMPMMTVFGSSGQDLLLQCHRLCALALLGVSALVLAGAIRKRN